MNLTRRSALFSSLFGAGYVGLRALATGLPASLLANPRQAFADPNAACTTATRAEFVIFNTSGSGDPINANAPGTYGDPKIVHPQAWQTGTPLTLAGQGTLAAQPWSTLPQSILDQTQFWHIMTNTPVHPKEPQVLELMGATSTLGNEMFPSILAKALAPCLGTIQVQPVSVGALTPSETLLFGGSPLPNIPPTALRATLASPAGPLTQLEQLRNSTMNDLYALYKNGASPAQQQFVDSLVTSQQQVQHIQQSLLAALAGIKDNSPAAQITAALTLIQMNVTPLVAVHFPFGGDNHRDIALATEMQQTTDGVQSIEALMQAIQSAGLAGKVMFMSLNVFGRTIGPGNADGRQHNPNHQVSIAIGGRLKGGVYGAVAPVMNDYGATAMDSKTGAGSSSGDIQPTDTLAAWGMTMLSAVGADPTMLASPAFPTATPVTAALAS